MDDLQNLQQKIEHLTFLFKSHKHLGTDFTPPLDSVTVHAGYVLAAGTAGTPLPLGWTTSRTADPGRYRVTHNLQTTKYVVVLTANADTTADRNVTLEVRNGNSFDYRVSDMGGTLQNCDVMFLLRNVS